MYFFHFLGHDAIDQQCFFVSTCSSYKRLSFNNLILVKVILSSSYRDVDIYTPVQIMEHKVSTQPLPLQQITAALSISLFHDTDVSTKIPLSMKQVNYFQRKSGQVRNFNFDFNDVLSIYPNSKTRYFSWSEIFNNATKASHSFTPPLCVFVSF